MNDSAQQNSQPNPIPVDTSMGDGNSIPPFPVGGGTTQTPTQNAMPQTPPTPAEPEPASSATQGSAAPTPPVTPEPPVADATAGNQPTVGETPPPPGDGQTITTFKPTRGKFGPKGVIATVFGILVLVAATIVGITQVGQQQIFREKASSTLPSCSDGAACNYVADTGTTADTTGNSRNCQNNDQTCTQECQPSGQYGNPQSCSSTTTTAGATCVFDHVIEPGECSADKTQICKQVQAELGIPNNGGGCTQSPYTIPGTGGYCLSTTSCNLDPQCSPALPGQCDTTATSATTNSTGTFCVGWTCPNGDTNGDGQCTSADSGASHSSFLPDGSCSSSCGQIDKYTESGNFDSFTGDFSLTGGFPECGGSSDFCAGSCIGNIGDPLSKWDPNNTNSNDTFQNCGSIGLIGDSRGNSQCSSSERWCCSNGGGGGGKGKCGGVGIELNGQYTKSSGRVANGWHTATLSEVQALQPGDTVRLTVGAGSANGANNPDWEQFTKARFSINGGALIETTNHYDKISQKVGLYGRVFYYEYVIPAGVTDFTIQGQVYYKKGQNPGWL